MVGYGLRKFAKENGMREDCGVAYGVLRGYGVTLSEGSGYKQMLICTRLPDPAGKQKLTQALESCDLNQQYRVTNFGMASNGINVVFHDNPGTMKKMLAFMDWLFPLLEEAGATKADIFQECGSPILEKPTWLLRGGVAAMPVHQACAERVCRSVARQNEARLEEETGSYVTGAVGALLGGALGAVVWSLVLMLNLIAGLVGLLIGILSEKGYTLLKGKQGKGKVAILVAAIVISVILGTLGGTALVVVKTMLEQELPLELFGEYVGLLLEVPEFTESVLHNGLLGLVFAGVGTFGILQRENSRITGEKPRILK